MTFYLEVIERQANDLAETIGRLTDTYLSDNSVSIEDRWAAYLKIETYLPNDPYGDGFIEKLGWENPYDHFGMERYVQRSFSTIWEMLLDQAYWAKEHPEDYAEDELEDLRTQEQLDAWREAVLSSGFGSFTNDW